MRLFLYWSFDMISFTILDRFMQKQMGIWRSTGNDECELNGLYTARTEPTGAENG